MGDLMMRTRVETGDVMRYRCDDSMEIKIRLLCEKKGCETMWCKIDEREYFEDFVHIGLCDSD